MRVWLGFCGLMLAANVCAAEGASRLDWLKTAAFAGHQTDYSGVFVYQYGNHVETSRISHVVETDSEYEKLESLDGPKREIIRHHGQVWCYTNHKMVQVDSQSGRGRFPLLLPAQLSALSENYQVKEAGVERVAGYNTQVILYQPRDNLRYTHKIWVHTDSGLLLKSAVLNEKNQVVEQYAFTELKIGGEVDRSWVASSTPGNSKPALNKAAMTVNSGWVVDALPNGFKKTMEILRPMHGKHASVTQLVFSDGLSAISVFIEPADADEDDNEGLTSRGAVNLYHKVVDKHLYNVVGEVPPKTVMQVLDSIRFNGKQ
ncbi:MAG: MucB/RseB C-terminal domain-containing protein [Gallionella sp.]|nr:MucB/RseB C-terminal domain-containing protein [Gallionella sp.]